ncbi:hypothetical protein BJV78DRAFT_1243814 [Lactifluus subvellereus]|nr:hypothetical protein BJV78DRAFT_1243814 [Lactifluus subvellereus]
MDIKWVMDASVRPGSFCSVQGAVKHISDVGWLTRALHCRTLVISLYTFRTLCFMNVLSYYDDQLHEEKTRRKRVHRSLVVVVYVWAGVALIVVVNVAVNGMECWIRSEYSIQRTACDFGLLWITAAANIVIYAILFLYFREPVNIHGPLKQAFGLLFVRCPSASVILFLYPLVYILTVLPVSITAPYRTLQHHRVPFAVTVFVDTICLSSGLLSVILFSTTRPFLLPHDTPTSGTMSETRYDIRLAASEVLLDETIGAENASIHSLGS